MSSQFQSERAKERNALRNIQRYASSMKAKLPYAIPMPNTSYSLTTIPDFLLPLPQNILDPISRLPLPEKMRQRIRDACQNGIGQLQQEYADKYRCLYSLGIFESSFNLDPKALHAVYTSMARRYAIPSVNSWISTIEAEAAKEERRMTLACDLRRPFNNEYTPVLEKYFEYNAYPSAGHRASLAEATRMTRRQIEVWFQNHRNRAKKEGKALRRLSARFPLNMALGVIPCHDDSPISEDSSSETADNDWQCEQAYIPSSCIEVKNVHEDPFRPSHAYPTTFAQARTRSDPFPANNEIFKLLPRAWMRKPAIMPRKEEPIVDIDNLTMLFQLKMSFLEKKRSSTPPISIGKQEPWYTATVTNLPRRQHPAFSPSSFISPTSSTLLSNIMHRFPAGSGNVTVSNAFLAPSPLGSSKSKKYLPFPKHRPSTSIGHLSSHSPNSQSRSSSSSSNASCGSVESLSISGDSSPEPSTPPQLPETAVISNPSEFDLGGFSFDLFSFLNHPDFSLNIPGAIDRDTSYKPPPTVDPSMLTYSNFS